MRILVVGASGTIGLAVADAFAARGHEVVRASRNGAVKVDISEPASIKAMYAALPRLDAVISCAGNTRWAAVAALSDDDLAYTLANKVVGQVNLVRFGFDQVNDGGAFILTAGIFGMHPIPGVPAPALANGAVEAFARAAALDLPRGLRIATISPPFIDETAKKYNMGSGLPAADNAKAYVAFVEASRDTGTVIFT